MPLYQFRCPNGHESDINRAADDSTRDATCPECGALARRLYRLRGIGFRGPGFHNTTYPAERARPAQHG